MDKSKWIAANAMDLTNGNSIPPSYPNEFMVKVFSTAYYSSLFGAAVGPGKRVLDMGCGFGNNLVYFLDRGVEGIGVEINDDMVVVANKNLKRLGYNAQVVYGQNDKAPFGDKQFDYLISVNTIHYQEGPDGIKKALQEFRRLVKDDGKVFIMTAGPGHEIRAKARKRGPFLHEVQDYGFRSGELFAFFDDKEHLRQTVREHFGSVEVGCLREEYSVRTLEFLYAVCRP